MDRYEESDLCKLPGEGEKTASDMVIKARARDMGGDFSVMEGVIEAKALLAPHTHKFEDQLIYIITGEVGMEVGGEGGMVFTAPAGSYVQKPRGIMHAFWNPTDEPVRYMELSGRSGFEGFVDSKANGDLYAMSHAEDDWGMMVHPKDTIRLMKEHNLSSVAMMDLKNLIKAPEVPTKVKDFFSKLKG